MVFDPAKYRVNNQQPAQPSTISQGSNGANNGFDPSKYRVNPNVQAPVSPVGNTIPMAGSPLSQSIPSSLQSAQNAPQPINDGLHGVSNFANSPGAAIIGGLSNGAATGLQNILDGGAYILNKIGIVSPKAKQEFEDKIANVASYAKTGTGAQGGASDPFNQAAASNPITNTIASGVGQGTMMLAGSPPAMKLGSLLDPAVNTAVNVAKDAGYIGMYNAGSAANNPYVTQDAAFRGGALGGAILSGAGQIIGQGAAKAAPILKNQFQNAIQNITNSVGSNPQLDVIGKAANMIVGTAQAAKDESNNLYSTVKNLPGSINTSPVSQMVSNLQSAGQGMMTPEQNQVLAGLQQMIPNVKNMSDAVELRNAISSGMSQFTNGSASNLFKGYKQLGSIIDTQIGAKAADAGLGDIWNQAKDQFANKIVPLQDMGAMDLLNQANKVGSSPMQDAQFTAMANKVLGNFTSNPIAAKQAMSMLGPDGGSLIATGAIAKNLGQYANDMTGFDPNGALRFVNKTMNNMQGIIPSSSMQPLQGIKQILQNMGATGAKTALPTDAGQSLAKYAGLAGQAAVGAGLGYAAGGKEGAATGGILGTALGSQLGATLGEKISNLYNSELGRNILGAIGNGNMVTNATKNIAASVLGKELTNIDPGTNNGQQ